MQDVTGAPNGANINTNAEGHPPEATAGFFESCSDRELAAYAIGMGGDPNDILDVISDLLEEIQRTLDREFGLGANRDSGLDDVHMGIITRIEFRCGVARELIRRSLDDRRAEVRAREVGR